MDKRCPKCQSERWMTRLPLLDSPMIHVKPVTGWLTAPAGLSGIRAHICADCGFTEFYAVSPLVVWEAWEKYGPPP
jgi:hypothetical protein